VKVRAMKHLIIALFSVLNIVTGYAQAVRWYSIVEALELNKEEPRNIIIDVYTDWCGWCKVMEKTTYNQEIIAEYLNKKFYVVKLNAEQREDIKIGDKTYKYVPYGQRGYHELAAVLLGGNMVYPSVVFLDEKGRKIHSLQGYIKAKPFDEIIKYIGEGYYLTKSWDEFIAGYKSQIPE
jgi:thioredoxin-related protein